jgi:hypothetical protein
MGLGLGMGEMRRGRTGHEELGVGVDIDVELDAVAGCKVVEVVSEDFVFCGVTCCLPWVGG